MTSTFPTTRHPTEIFPQTLAAITAHQDGTAITIRVPLPKHSCLEEVIHILQQTKWKRSMKQPKKRKANITVLASAYLTNFSYYIKDGKRIGKTKEKF